MTSPEQTPNRRNATVDEEKIPVSPAQRLRNATRYSLKGIRTTFQSEQAFRFETYILIVALPLAFIVGKTPMEYIALLGSVIFVLIVELFNTSVEMVVDRIGVEQHELSGAAKDAGSAAVFISIITSLAIWLTLAFT